MQIVPYTFEGTVQLPQAPSIATPGLVQGVHIVVGSPDLRDWLACKIKAWFAQREEVTLVDVGVSDKQSTAYLMVEWDQCQIDPLFLAILQDEEMIVDYTTYVRAVEGEDQ